MNLTHVTSLFKLRKPTLVFLKLYTHELGTWFIEQTIYSFVCRYDTNVFLLGTNVGWSKVEA